MSLESPQFRSRLKQLFLRPLFPELEQDYVPYFYIETRIDFADVRTGFHMTCGLHNVLDMDRFEDDLVWTRDMVRAVDPKALLNWKPKEAKLRDLPLNIDEEVLNRLETRYMKYLLRHAEARVLRNSTLNFYSAPGECAEDFEARCQEVLNDSFRRDLDVLREVVNRRLERIEQRYLTFGQTDIFESDPRLTQARSRFHTFSEIIIGLFLRTELTVETQDAVRSLSVRDSRPDLEQELEALDVDVRKDIRRLRNSYQEKVRSNDEYIIHPGLKDLHLVRTCILWMPEKALNAWLGVEMLLR